MTGDPALAMADLTVVLQPTPTNGCSKVSYLLPQSLTCVAKTRITAATESRITVAELQQLRQMVVLAIGGLSWIPGYAANTASDQSKGRPKRPSLRCQPSGKPGSGGT